ncbi:MAG: hypothetical protein Q7S88_03280, partial [Candidatus Daviesbacteria bacterium]|nr:hypothetical protein [Candidatus Daviesbacteria bacterium]
MIPELKGEASLTLGKVIEQTRNNFPDPRFRPQVYLETGQYHQYGINPSPYSVWITADGIGTKPELAERLSALNNDPSYFSTLAFDTFAMVADDEARNGRFTLGVANIIDVNSADPRVVHYLAQSAKDACDTGQFALLAGETAELGYRSSGYGSTRVNWNAVAISLVVPNKLVLGDALRPGQPIVACREKSIRSNGLTRARGILEEEYLQTYGYHSKQEYLLDKLAELIPFDEIDGDGVDVIFTLDDIFGHPVLEQVLIPWHELNPQTTKDLLTPSRIYSPLVYEALGGVDEEKLIDITGMAHITGGGIPEKMRRLLQPKGLGASLDAVFPDPQGVQKLLAIAEKLPNGEKLIDDKTACHQWNRGI